MIRRPQRPEDAAFAAILFERTQGAALAGLDPALRRTLLAQQRAGQEAGYRSQHPGAAYEIVECDGVPAGRLVTERTDEALTVLDIALLPERRGQGLGTRLLRAVLAEGRAAGLPVRLSVLSGNEGARRLYARLGFGVVAVRAPRLDLEWRPADAAPE